MIGEKCLQLEVEREERYELVRTRGERWVLQGRNNYELVIENLYEGLDGNYTEGEENKLERESQVVVIVYREARVVGYKWVRLSELCNKASQEEFQEEQCCEEVMLDKRWLEAMGDYDVSVTVHLCGLYLPKQYATSMHLSYLMLAR